MRQYINFITNEADLTYKIKVAELTTYSSLYDLEDKELSQTLDKLNDKFYNELEGEIMSVTCAMNDIATKYIHPSAKKIFIDFDSSDKENKDDSLSKLILEHKKEYDDLYSSYISPMTDREKNLTGLAIMNEIDKFKPDKNLPDNTNAILMMLRDEAKLYPVQRKTIRDFISGSIPDCYKSMLNKNLSKEDINKIKKVAIDLLEKIKAKISELDHWTEKQETKAEVDTLIGTILWEELPESYSDNAIFAYRQKIYEYVFMRYKEVA